MYYFKHAINKQDKVDAFKLRYKIYCQEKKWCKAEDYEDNQEIDIYDSASDIFIAKDDCEKTIGTARLINHTESLGLQIAKLPGFTNSENFHKCSEISRLATQKKYRSGPIAMGLIRIIYNHILKNPNNYNYLYIVVENKFFRILNAIGFSFVAQGEPTLFWGDLLVVARMKVSEMDKLAYAKNPAFHNWLHQDSLYLDENTSFTGFCKTSKKLKQPKFQTQENQISA